MKKLFALLLVLLTLPALARAAETESAFDRIQRTGTIRCGYGLWAPLLNKDPNSGALSGFLYDFFNEMGEKLELKVEWTTETGFGTAIADLNAGKFDVFCSGIWANAVRGKVADFTAPIFFQAQRLVVREGDHRFDADTKLLNSPGVRMATMDGEMSSIVQRQSFPAAEPVSLVDGDMKQLLFMVTQSKADFTAAEADFLRGYMEANPGQLRTIGAPIRLMPVVYPVAKGDARLQNMLDAAILEMRASRRLDEMLGLHPELRGVYRLPPLYAEAP